MFAVYAVTWYLVDDEKWETDFLSIRKEGTIPHLHLFIEPSGGRLPAADYRLELSINLQDGLFEIQNNKILWEET